MTSIFMPGVINKIKVVREKCGLTLREAKDLVESYPTLSIEELLAKQGIGELKSYAFEIEYNSGALDLYRCEATSWKQVWDALGAHIINKVEAGDTVVNIGMC